MPDIQDSSSTSAYAVALIVPDSKRRLALATTLAGSPSATATEFNTYPSASELREVGRVNHVVIVDLDSGVDPALEVIQTLCSRYATTTVMAYSSKTDPTLMRRAMQAGAREFLIDPILPETLGEALHRAVARGSEQRKELAKTLVFMQTKGGVGVSTIAVNFALALTKESATKVVIVDLDFQLGEVALLLGMTANFCTADALLNSTRLDGEFLSTLLLRHSSGLSALPSGEEYKIFHGEGNSMDKLFQVLREEFDYVVIDAGTCHSRIQETVLEIADTLYLVTEMKFPSLRNAHRLIAFLDAKDLSGGLEVVLNRFNSRRGEIDEASATKAIGRAIRWRIPNDYAVARAAQDTGVPIMTEDSPITRALIEMAKTACGKPLTPAKKSGIFSFFGSHPLPEGGGT